MSHVSWDSWRALELAEHFEEPIVVLWEVKDLMIKHSQLLETF